MFRDVLGRNTALVGLFRNADDISFPFLLETLPKIFPIIISAYNDHHIPEKINMPS